MLVVDDTTLADCQRKLVALKARMANGDEAAAVEHEKVARYVKGATGLRGRTRYFSDDSERARVNVTRTVRQATDYILTIDADAGRYLHGTIRTGARCCYRPDGAD